MLQLPIDNAPHWTSRQTRHRLLGLGLAGALVVVLLGGVLWVNRLRAINRDNARLLNTFSVSLRDISGVLRDMQASLRGYLLTGDETILDGYARGDARLPRLSPTLQAYAPQVDPNAPDQVRDLIASADAWRKAMTPESNRPPQGRTAADLTDVAVRDQRLSDDLQTHVTQLTTTGRSADSALTAMSNRLILISDILFGLLSLTTLLALIYGILLVRRLGMSAANLHNRQRRQVGYTQVISALNGPTQLQSLVDQALPTILASVDAQAGVVY